MQRVRDDKLAVESQLHDKTRQLADFQAKFDAHCADVNTRYYCNEVHYLVKCAASRLTYSVHHRVDVGVVDDDDAGTGRCGC